MVGKTKIRHNRPQPSDDVEISEARKTPAKYTLGMASPHIFKNIDETMPNKIPITRSGAAICLALIEVG